VGYAVAKALAQEQHDVVVIDNDSERIENVTNTVDVMGVVGHGASFKVQLEAGVQSADLLIALTSSDELNLLCCMIARKAGRCQTIARVTDPVYMEQIPYIKQELGLAMTLNPERATAQDITRLCKMPSAIEIDTFVKGHVEILKVEIPQGCFLHHKTISDVMRGFEKVLICAVEHDGEVEIPLGNYMLSEGDRIAIVGDQKSSAAFVKKMGVPGFGKVRSAILIGAETMGEYVAKEMIRQGIHVKVFDSDKKRCERFSVEVPDAIVLNADASKPDCLFEEGLERVDAFLTLTSSDELNILLSLFAKKNSNCKVVTLMNHLNYVGVIKSLNIGSIMSLQSISTEYIVQYVRAMKDSQGSNVETLYRIMDDRVDALEFVIGENCPIKDIPLKDLNIKSDILISCINHLNRIEIPNGQSEIHAGDTVVVVTTREGFDDIMDIIE
jgi:trk system potassium uptake protein TrkA